MGYLDITGFQPVSSHRHFSYAVLFCIERLLKVLPTFIVFPV